MDDPLKVLHVVVNMNRGGAETLIMNLYRHIDRNKVQFDFLTFKSGVFDKEIISMGGRVHRIPYITDVGHFAFIRELGKFFEKHREYTIVHSHMDKMSGFILNAARKANIPFRIAHSHNTESEGGFLAKAYKWYGGVHILTSATHLYACSQKAANWLYRNNAKQAYILKNGVETEQFKFSANIRATVRNELQIRQDTLVLGHVGRFNHQKNHVYLLELFSKITKEIPSVELVLVGDGSLRARMDKKIKELNVEKKVKMLGIREDPNRLLQAFDLFLFPSLHEGLPVTLIEAQSAGLPCLISDTITSEVDMGIGLVHYMPLADQKSWINKIRHLKSEKRSRDIAQIALAKQGYDIRKTAELTETTYLTLGENAI